MELDRQSFATQMGRLCRQELAAASTAGDIERAMGRIVQRVETLLHEAMPEEERAFIACSAGCGTCCLLNVNVLVPEVIAVDGFLRRNWPAAQIELLCRRLQDKRDSGWYADEDQVFLQSPCVFLDEEGCCAIYPVRPLLCRSITSIDPEQCRRAMEAQAFGETSPVLMNLRQKAMLEATYEALAESLHELGRDHQGYGLTQVADRLLDNPGRASHWLAGGRIMAD